MIKYFNEHLRERYVSHRYLVSYLHMNKDGFLARETTMLDYLDPEYKKELLDGVKDPNIIKDSIKFFKIIEE
jgi:hypothetical protein